MIESHILGVGPNQDDSIVSVHYFRYHIIKNLSTSMKLRKESFVVFDIIQMPWHFLCSFCYWY